MSSGRTIRLFVPDALAAGGLVALSEAQSHYAVHVMRLKPGARVLVFNGRDGEWSATLESATRKSFALGLEAQTRAQLPEPDVWLLFAPLKRARNEWLVEKCTELGAAALVPVMTLHTNAERVNVERLTAIAVEAAEQCERLTVPEVRAPMALAHVIAQWPSARRLFVLDETGAGAPVAAAAQNHGSGPCAFLIGPEGGFAQSELDDLGQLPFVTRVGLGPRVLRAETAALAALACYQALAVDGR
ncbi:MAG: 16S rRNA (uracil(1498)-N(3))-methyltransferase [Rhodospirillaceae bacterium]|nr:16S rRNA (uracil(1498)-N(3))-methyltransferase [Rhodospirillaceae bacterium]